VTSIPQPALTAYHRLLGRFVIVPLICSHAALFLLFYVQVPHPVFGTIFAKRIRDPDVQFGLAATVFATLVLVFGRANVWRLRERLSVVKPEARRQLFYVVHLVLVSVFFVLAYSHVRYARPFVLETVGASVANLVCCKLLASR
jgi:Ferric reductase like transmembrane component